MEKTESYVEVDVREDISLKKEPFQKIMDAVNSLKPGQDLVLHAPFNPLPLYKVMGRKGFTHFAAHIDKKHWKIIFRKDKEEKHYDA